MTRADVYDWLEVHDCKPEPIEGVNTTGWSVRIVNRKNKRYAYFKTPIDDTEMPDKYVRKLCVEDLWIPCPNIID